MHAALIVLSAGLLGVIVYFAVSPKSSRILRLAALGALVLIALSIGVCGVFLIRGPAEAAEELSFPVFQEGEPPPKEGNGPAIAAFLAVFLLVLGFIVFIALRSQSKAAGGKGKTDNPRAAQKPDGERAKEEFEIKLE